MRNGSPKTNFFFPPNLPFIRPQTTLDESFPCASSVPRIQRSSSSLKALGAAEGQRAAEAGEPEVNGEMKEDEREEGEEIQLVDSEGGDVTRCLAGL